MAQQQQHPRQRPNTLGLPDLPAYNFLGDKHKDTVIDNLPDAQARQDLETIRKWIRFIKMVGTPGDELDEELDDYFSTETLLKQKLDELPDIYDIYHSSSESESSSGSGILENYLKLNPFSGAGLFDELAKMRTPEGQDRSYCSRSFAMYRFPKGEYEKAMNNCIAKRKKERESKTEGNGVPLVALAGIASRFRGHL